MIDSVSITNTILVSVTVNIIAGFIYSIVSNLLSRRVAEIVSTTVDRSNIILCNLNVSTPMYNQLKKIVQRNGIPIKIIVEAIYKKERKLTLVKQDTLEILKESIITCNQSKMQPIVEQIADNLFWADYITAISIFTMFLAIFPLIMIPVIKTKCDLLTIQFTTLFPMLLLLIGVALKYIRKRRYLTFHSLS